MKLIIDIPDSDYTAVRCEALYYIGHDKLAKSVTTAFQTAIPYEEQPQGVWINRETGGTMYPFWERYECNQCHKFNYYFNFCPNCGAEMKGGAE